LQQNPMMRGMVLVLALAAATLSGCQNPVRDGGGHRVARDVVITAADDADNVLMRTQDNAQWLGGPLTVPVDGSREVRIFFVSPTGERFQLPAAGASHTLYVGIGDAAIAGYEPVSTERGRFAGRSAGTTTGRIYLWHGVHPAGHEDYFTPEFTIQVVQQ
jgi:predicted small secreted protein